MTNQYLAAYAAALAADSAFSAELVRAYGVRAGDARYRRTHTDPAVTAAMNAKLAADAVLQPLADHDYNRGLAV